MGIIHTKTDKTKTTQNKTVGKIHYTPYDPVQVVVDTSVTMSIERDLEAHEERMRLVNT